MDLISRAWLKEAIHNFFNGLIHKVTEEDIQAYIEVAPSAFEGMTNIEVIKAVFPNLKYNRGDGFTMIEADNHATRILIWDSFGDSPYKGGEQMTLEDKAKAIEHEIMMNEELISRDEVITLIARKHLSKEENFHGAITRLNRQVKALKPITIKAELAEILDKISAEIKEVTMKRPMTMDYECGLNEARSIIEKYKGVSE